MIILPMLVPPRVNYGKCDLDAGALNFKIDPSHDLWVYDGGATRNDFEAAFKQLVGKWRGGRKIDFADAEDAKRIVQQFVNQWYNKGYSRFYRKRKRANA